MRYINNFKAFATTNVEWKSTCIFLIKIHMNGLWISDHNQQFMFYIFITDIPGTWKYIFFLLLWNIDTNVELKMSNIDAIIATLI